MNAGFSEITPIALSPELQAVTSFSPPTEITVPTSYSASVKYFSAKSAYLAAVAVPLNKLAVRSPAPSLAAIVLGVAVVLALL